MESNIIIPGTGVSLEDGDIIQIQKFPNVSQILHFGWFLFEGNQTFGWYIVSIPDEIVNPILPEDLIGCTIISKYNKYPIPPIPPTFVTKEEFDATVTYLQAQIDELKNIINS